MEIKNLFERTEKKYIITASQQHALIRLIGHKLTEDAYPRSTIRSLYFDTDDYRMIRTSVEKPVYKEKLRLRSYCTPNQDTKVFLELKKKFDGVVYKRRECMSLREAEQFAQTGIAVRDTQICREIQWAFRQYPNLTPKMFISYNRLALKAKEEPEVRITFDWNLLFRNTDLDLQGGVYGRRLLAKDHMIMEIKALNAMPLWLCDALDKLQIFPASFSKYGTAYRICQRGNLLSKGEHTCA